ncbi:MAG: cytochrome C, partial [Runella slithyformis]
MKSLNFLKSSFIIRFTLCVGLLYAGQLAAQDGDAANGETLFKNNCASCHNPGDQVVVG